MSHLYIYTYIGASLVAQTVKKKKNLPTMQKTWILSLGWEDPPEKEMVNGYPLQYSCLENSTDRGARWATVHEVTKS